MNNIIVLVLLAVLAIPVSTAFLKLMNKSLQRHATLLLAEEGICSPHIHINPVALWATVSLLLLLIYRSSVDAFAMVFNVIFLLGLLLIAYIDIKYQYIFDEVLIVMATVGILATPYIQYSLLNRLGAVLIGGAIMLLIAIASKGMLGGGDIKLVAMLGLWQGLGGLYTCLTVGFFSAALFAVLALVSGRKKMHDSLAFGPYLVLGAFVHWLRL